MLWRTAVLAALFSFLLTGQPLNDTPTGAAQGDEPATFIAPIKEKREETKPQPAEEEGFRVKPAVNQYLIFVGIQHAFRMTEAKTRRELVGPFFKDWWESVKSLQGWKDGGRQFTNYVAHPMEGAIYGYIQIQNDTRGMNEEFGLSGRYWRSRLKAMAWSAAGSAQFELGPLSQASIGNVGAGIYEAKKMTYVDLVITPTLGTVWIVLEDMIDRHVIARIDRNFENSIVRAVARMVLNPMRTSGNSLRGQAPWHRDVRGF
jgi:hypothetical protein